MKTLLLTLLCLTTLSVAARAQTTPSADSLKAYVGTYTFTSGSPVSKFTVTADKGVLYGEADGYGANKLVKQPAADTYQSTSSYGSMITFLRDATTKAVTSLALSAQGNELSAKKENP